MKDLKIAIIRQKYRDDGGAEQFISRAMQALGTTNINISLITRKWSGNGPFTAIICKPVILGRILREYLFKRCACTAVSRNHFDLVQSHERLPCCDIYRAGDGVHREWVETRKRHSSLLGRWALSLSLFHHYVMASEQSMLSSSRLKKVICISKLVKSDILKHFPDTDPDKLVIIYNGIDLDQYAPGDAGERSYLVESLGIPATSRLLLAVGSGFYRKGMDTAVRALPDCPDHWHLVIVGKDKRQARLASEAKALGLADRVHFTGIVRDPRPYYRSADLFVHPALYEPFGNVVLEAMACGTAVIASNRCGGSELIHEGKNGFVCKPAAPKELAAIISGITEQELPLMGVQARKIAEQYPLDRLRDEMLGLYKELLVDRQDT